ncbi:unnamed protein product [Oppiella nova]|uniref:Uncharacterized protein n=1 Tax=Oppiella nova TaxID=334625 RepID=A0A7R9MSQ4_9ACAR|nr:unnamed protein product [Oppiella nova]CAG2182843.1 unnamed protein product [Oppiella nova]
MASKQHKRFAPPLKTSSNTSTPVTTDTTDTGDKRAIGAPIATPAITPCNGFRFLTASGKELTLCHQLIQTMADTMNVQLDDKTQQLMANDNQLVPKVDANDVNNCLMTSMALSDEELFRCLESDSDWIAKTCDELNDNQRSAKRSTLEPMVCGSNQKKSRLDEL